MATFVENCPNSQQVKVEHQKPSGLAQDINIPTWKLEELNMDLVKGLPHTYSRHDFILEL